MGESLGVMAAVTAACAACMFEAGDTELSPDIHVRELKAHVFHLAAPEYLGRSGPGAARVSRELAEAFRKLGLRPAFGPSYFQDIPDVLYQGTDRAGILGRNVAAILPGSDERLKDEWVLLGAHFDHLGIRKGQLCPGADDNATGVAMLLEVAEHFALTRHRPRRTLVFAAFDLEEAGTLGSRHLASHPPLPLSRLKAFLTADMLGRSMANVMDEYVFVLGSETSPRLRRLLEEVTPPRGLTGGRLGADLIGTRSDYGPFRDHEIPFLFFTTGQHPDYHRPTDTPERIDYDKLCRASVWIRDLLRRLADDDDAPAWDPTENLSLDIEEIRTVTALVHRVLDRPDIYPLSAKKKDLVEGVEKRLAGILRRGHVVAGDRTWLLWTARLMLATVF
jgi:hypothetical protein